MSTLDELQKDYTKRLSKKANVVGVGQGQKHVEGRPTSTAALIVFVEKKVDPDAIVKMSDMIPKQISGVPVDVIEVGKLVKQGFEQRIRPVQPGYSCGHQAITAGTIGGVFLDKDGDQVILSNNHVLAAENKAKIGDNIVQPGPIDGGGEIIATLKDFVKLRRKGNNQDSAIARLTDDITVHDAVGPLYPHLNQQLRGFGQAQVNQSVQKCGRTTGYTAGRIMALNGQFTIGYDFGGATFDGCIVTTSMSDGGDSGSVIMDMDMNAVGLLFAGSAKVTLATPIDIVQQQYGLRLWADTTNFEPINIASSQWKSYPSDGNNIVVNGDVVDITCKANHYCYMEHPLEAGVQMVSCDIFTGTDGGATWGPGIAVCWPTSNLRLNTRKGGQFSVCFQGNEYMGWGHIKPDTWYNLRIRIGNTVIAEAEELGDGQDGVSWTKIMEFPRSLVPQPPVCVRIGKMDMNGGRSNYQEAGVDGACKIKNIKIS